jgi:hypothetical protein
METSHVIPWTRQITKDHKDAALLAAVTQFESDDDEIRRVHHGHLDTDPADADLERVHAAWRDAIEAVIDAPRASTWDGVRARAIAFVRAQEMFVEEDGERTLARLFTEVLLDGRAVASVDAGWV